MNCAHVRRLARGAALAIKESSLRKTAPNPRRGDCTERRAARWVRLSEKIPFSRRNSSAHRAAAVRSGACCIFPTERHCSVERERCLLKEIRLLISALENALPLPRSHRRRAAAASTAGHRRTRLPHCSLTVRARL